MSEPPTREAGTTTVAIMQPYFLPYIGYFQLIASADLFVVYDNIKYTKKGWINRNRILRGDQAVTVSLPLRADSDFLDVRDRRLADSWKPVTLLNQVRGAYRGAPFFAQTMPLIEQIAHFEDVNLFRFIEHSIREICSHIDIRTEIRASSGVSIDPALKGQAKVLAICATTGATRYINAIGGLELYSRAGFRNAGLTLQFLRSTAFEYPQFGGPFVPWLSIVDVLMFNDVSLVKELVATRYELVEAPG